MSHGPLRPALDVGRLFDEHGAFVHRVAQRLTGSAARADDVTQEVFVLAMRRGHELADAPGIRTWLYRATINVSRQGFRTDRRYQGALDRFATAAPDTRTPDPEARVDAAESGARIRACVARLSPCQREVFVLFELEQLDGAEIASILGIPLNTVWSRLHSARTAFREAWGADGRHA